MLVPSPAAAAWNGHGKPPDAGDYEKRGEPGGFWYQCLMCTRGATNTHITCDTHLKALIGRQCEDDDSASASAAAPATWDGYGKPADAQLALQAAEHGLQQIIREQGITIKDMETRMKHLEQQVGDNSAYIQGLERRVTDLDIQAAGRSYP